MSEDMSAFDQDETGNAPISQAPQQINGLLQQQMGFVPPVYGGMYGGMYGGTGRYPAGLGMMNMQNNLLMQSRMMAMQNHDPNATPPELTPEMKALAENLVKLFQSIPKNGLDFQHVDNLGDFFNATKGFLTSLADVGKQAQADLNSVLVPLVAAAGVQLKGGDEHNFRAIMKKFEGSPMLEARKNALTPQEKEAYEKRQQDANHYGYEQGKEFVASFPKPTPSASVTKNQEAESGAVVFASEIPEMAQRDPRLNEMVQDIVAKNMVASPDDIQGPGWRAIAGARAYRGEDPHTGAPLRPSPESSPDVPPGSSIPGYS